MTSLNRSQIKQGNLSKEDKQYIKNNAGKLSIDKIAENLRRPPSKVKDFLTEQDLMQFYSEEEIEENVLNIRKSKHWPILCEQFTPKELDLFEYHWRAIVDQFRSDILHTEQLQILDAVKLEILINRKQSDEKKIKDMILDIDRQLIEEKRKSPPPVNIIADLERNRASLFASIESLGKEASSLMKQKKDLLSSLKATREQRIQQIESSKETLTGWIKTLYTDPQLRYKIGVEMEKVRIAAKAEYEKLADFFTYADGLIDKPVLTSETVCNTKTTEMILDTTKPEESV